MLSLTVKTGEAIAIGNVACVKVLDKSGQRVRLVVATRRSNPVRIIPTGIIPPRLAVGIEKEKTPLNVMDTQMTWAF